MIVLIPGRPYSTVAARAATMLGLALAVVALGLLLRFGGPHLSLPAPLVKYGGSVLWEQWCCSWSQHSALAWRLSALPRSPWSLPPSSN
jgi:hypothetical protein